MKIKKLVGETYGLLAFVPQGGVFAYCGRLFMRLGSNPRCPAHQNMCWCVELSNGHQTQISVDVHVRYYLHAVLSRGVKGARAMQRCRSEQTY